jgi:Xaa-Pro aminopeptidase
VYSLLTGELHKVKIERLQEELRKKNYKAIVVAMLDEIAWLFNLRGSDIAFNPVFFAYAVVSQTSATLFVDPVQVTEVVNRHLGEGVQIKPYTEFFPYLNSMVAEYEPSKDIVSIKSILVSLALISCYRW